MNSGSENLGRRQILKGAAAVALTGEVLGGIPAATGRTIEEGEVPESTHKIREEMRGQLKAFLQLTEQFQGGDRSLKARDQALFETEALIKRLELFHRIARAVLESGPEDRYYEPGVAHIADLFRNNIEDTRPTTAGISAISVIETMRKHIRDILALVRPDRALVVELGALDKKLVESRLRILPLQRNP